MESGISHLTVLKIDDEKTEACMDVIAVEEPLEINLRYGSATNRKQQNLAVTMRTPGSDEALALGFLFSEGLISQMSDMMQITRLPQKKQHYEENTILVELAHSVPVDFERLSRHFYTSSSCGVCGKTSIEMVQSTIYHFSRPGYPKVGKAVLYSLPETLRKAQSVFDSTGSIHAAGLFSSTGELLFLKEDVGRHNALDKLLGTALLRGLIPLKEHILLLSGRISFELVQKALMAGVPIIAAVGAPSTLAISMADTYGASLIGFLKKNKFNVYCGKDRIIL